MAIKKIQYRYGFTIVELLIVVVVIAILAAITIVAFNGVQRRAAESGMQSDLKTGTTVLETDKVTAGNSTYPGTLAEANGGKGITTDSSNVLQYTLGDINSGSYCMSISSSRTTQVYHYSSTQGSIESGFCPGHSGSILTTLAGSTQGFADDPVGANARFYRPADVAVASNGNVYVSDRSNHRIRQITPAGAVTTIAGSSQGWSDNATGTSAQFNGPMGIAVDASGSNLYVSDAGTHRIRKISLTPPYAVTTIAGTGSSGYSDNATGTSAQFNNPYGIAVNASGVVYVAEANGNRIRAIAATAPYAVSTLAGPTSGTAGASGQTDNTGSLARFNSPHGIDVDASGNIYVADNANHRIRMVTPAGVVTTVAGTSDGFLEGAALSARFSWPEDVTVSSDGKIYIVDAYNSLIRSVISGTAGTLIGQRFNSGFSDGVGANGRINYPWGLDVGSDGMVYVADTWNNRIRKIEPR